MSSGTIRTGRLRALLAIMVGMLAAAALGGSALALRQALGVRVPQAEVQNHAAATSNMSSIGGVQACSNQSGLRVALGALTADMSSKFYTFEITSSGSACTLKGYPSVSLLDSRGLADPPVSASHEPDIASSGTTVGTTTALHGSFFVRFFRCAFADTQLHVPYTLQITLPGVDGTYRFSNFAPPSCSPQLAVVSPVVQGEVRIPGFDYGGVRPSPVTRPTPPTKTPGATP